MRVSPLSPFPIGARVTVLYLGAEGLLGAVTKIGRRYVSVTLDGGREVHVHPNALRRTPARLIGYENFFI